MVNNDYLDTELPDKDGYRVRDTYTSLSGTRGDVSDSNVEVIQVTANRVDR